MKDGTPLLRRSIGAVLDVLDQEKFITQTIRKLLFGYANPLLKLGRDILPPDRRWPHPTFGLFVGVSLSALCLMIPTKLSLQKNATADGTLEALTGLGNRGQDDIGQIVAVNGKRKLNWWSGECNELKSGLHCAIKSTN